MLNSETHCTEQFDVEQHNLTVVEWLMKQEARSSSDGTTREKTQISKELSLSYSIFILVGGPARWKTVLECLYQKYHRAMQAAQFDGQEGQAQA